MPRKPDKPAVRKPPVRKPPTADELRARAAALHVKAQKWWKRLRRAFAELDKHERALARLRRAAKRAGLDY